MATLVTGGCGVLGSQVVAELASGGEEVVAYDVVHRPEMLPAPGDRHSFVSGDVLDLPSLLRAAKTIGVDRIIHTASLLTPVAMANPYAAFKVNLEGTLNVLEAARFLEMKRVVFCSSGNVYDPSVTPAGPIAEGFPLRPTTIYYTTKVASEYLGLNYAESYGVDFVILRFAGISGPGQPYPYGRLGLQPLAEYLEGPLRGEPARVTRPFQGRRQYLYARDAARALVLASHVQGLRSRVFNISSGALFTHDDLLAALGAAIPGFRAEVPQAPAERGFIPERTQPLDITRARAELGYEPRYDLEAGINDHVNWVRTRLGDRH